MPEILQTIDGPGEIFGYVMPTYAKVPPALYARPLELAEGTIDRLEAIWRIPLPAAMARDSVDCHSYAAYLRRLMAPYDPLLGRRIEALAGRLIWQGLRQEGNVVVHGDPTFENLVFDLTGEIILLDPNPQPAASLAIPELDVAKVMQSLCGWEAFVAGRSAVLHWDESLRPLVERRFGDGAWERCGWLLVGHLIRTLPYGAKVGDARRLLPTLWDFVEHLEGELGDAG